MSNATIKIKADIKGETKPGNKLYGVIRICHDDPGLSTPEVWAAKNERNLKKLMREDYVGEQDGIQYGSTAAEKREFAKDFDENEWGGGNGSGTIVFEEIGTIN